MRTPHVCPPPLPSPSPQYVRTPQDARTLRLQLEQALASLTSSCPDLEASVSTPAADDGADEDDADEADLPSGDETLLLLDRGGREQRRRRGVVVVRFASAAAASPPGAPEHEALRLHHKAGRAWEAMAAKAAWLLGGARREAAGGGGEGEGGGQGGGGGAPRLVVVSLGASFSTAAQIARHRTTAKLLTRVAKVGAARGFLEGRMQAVMQRHSDSDQTRFALGGRRGAGRAFSQPPPQPWGHQEDRPAAQQACLLGW
jgi:hypothetical protein